MGRIDRLEIFLDSMDGGAWPFLVGGVICLVISSVSIHALEHHEPRMLFLYHLKRKYSYIFFMGACKNLYPSD